MNLDTDEKTFRNLHNIVHPSQRQTKYIRATYVRAVCDIRYQKTETDITRLTARGKIVDYPREFITPTSYLTTMKLHMNSFIYDTKSRYL